jgi:excisionase family DNA binding protein
MQKHEKARYHNQGAAGDRFTRDERLLFSVQEVAYLLGVSRRTVFSLLCSGHIVRRKVLRRTMVHREDLIAFVESIARP